MHTMHGKIEEEASNRQKNQVNRVEVMRGEEQDGKATQDMVAEWEDSFSQVEWTDKNEYSNAQRQRGFFTLGKIPSMFAEVYDFCKSQGAEPIIQGNKVNFTVDDIIEGEASGRKVSVQITVKRQDKDDDYSHFV